MNAEDEPTFRCRLASILRGAYQFHVWHAHLEDGAPRFEVRGVKLGCPDLYVIPPPFSRIRQLFRRVAIEAKSELDMSKLMAGITQAIRYMEELTIARYVIDEADVPRPGIVLLATPDSVDHGEVYRWRGFAGSDLPHDPQGRRLYWQGMTRMLEHFLIARGAALLRWHPNGGLYFRSNLTPSRVIETIFLDAPARDALGPR